MNKTLSARDFMVDFLRREVVGPSPGYPAVQTNGEEILRPQDPPRRRYGAGVLFPMRTSMFRQEETGAEEISGEAGSPEEHRILEAQESVNNADGGISPGDNPSETEQEMALANQYLPSAMGLSALVEVPDYLRVEVSASEYEHDEFQWQPREDRNGRSVFPKAWWRRPIDCAIDIPSSELLGDKIQTLSKPVLKRNGTTALEIFVVSRPYPFPSRSLGTTRLITFTLVNRQRQREKTPDNVDCFFQCGFSVRGLSGEDCFLSYPESPHGSEDPEELSLQLLYQHKQTFAVGHGCAPEWGDPRKSRTNHIRTEVLPTFELKPILPRKIRGIKLRMADLASDELETSIALCAKLADAYEDWIAQREGEIDLRSDLSPVLEETARRHMKSCRECLRRVRGGISMLGRDPDVALSFQLMNRAMLMQQVHYTISSQKTRNWASSREGLRLKEPFDLPNYEDQKRKWRPFQLAFILMNIGAIADSESPERQTVDLIWFPTGGGKTEAYLGLSAFTMFLRRLRNPEHAGTTILMRYTLRLLTTQQFQRAASLICACEVIRRKERVRLGGRRYSIGLWVGGEVTPNSERNAVDVLRQLQSGRGVNKFVMLSCPWCGAAMGPQQDGRKTTCKGYQKLAHPDRVRLVCEDPDCEFKADDDGLPLAVIDEQIYEDPPTLLIGTVDKFAMLAFQPRARYLFGIDTPYPPPELIIQDELHLISGPLGSMVGHYETAIGALCTYEIRGKHIPAKIVASTATISHAESQVKSLYGRSAFLFPPQALRMGDSFFAEEREDKVGRLYVGVLASALPSHVTAQVRTMSALLQAPKLCATPNPEVIDPYWTMMGYFNSLRELGHAATLIRADIREYLNAMWDRLGLRLEMVKGSEVDPRRFINRDVELTSRVQSSEIPSILLRLFEKYRGPRTEAIDVCFATNMIQVGLDVPRLSLMTIVGQPKTTSEYIQASSRVGRDIERPGIVVVNYNPSKPRDRSHYEHFRSFHQSIYRHVEPTSVTPFAVPVRDRALHALVIILCRFWGDENLRSRPSVPPDPELVHKIKETIRQRVMSTDPNECSATEAQIDAIVQKWSNSPPSRYGGFGPQSQSEEMPLMYPAGGQQNPLWYQWPYPTPSSMRSVDADCAARPLLGSYG